MKPKKSQIIALIFLVCLLGNNKFYFYSLRGTQIEIKSIDPKPKSDEEVEVTHVHYGNIDILVQKNAPKKAKACSNKTSSTGSNASSSNLSPNSQSFPNIQKSINETIKQQEKKVKTIQNETTTNQIIINKQEKTLKNIHNETTKNQIQIKQQEISLKKLQNKTVTNQKIILQQEKRLNKLQNETSKNQIALNQQEEILMKLKNNTASVNNTIKEKVNQLPLIIQNLTIQNINGENLLNNKNKKENETDYNTPLNGTNKQSKENKILDEVVDFEQENYPINTEPQKLFMNYIKNHTKEKNLSTTNKDNSIKNDNSLFQNNSSNDFYQTNIIKRDNQYVPAKIISNNNVFYKQKEPYYQQIPKLNRNPILPVHKKIILPQLHIIPVTI